MELSQWLPVDLQNHLYYVAVKAGQAKSMTEYQQKVIDHLSDWRK